MVPQSVVLPKGLALPSTITFVVPAEAAHSPQTGFPWYVEMDREMGTISTYSLIPDNNNTNVYVSHYHVESRRPRFIGDFQFTDAWMTTNHKIFAHKNAQIHTSQTLFSPERADDKLYFAGAPFYRMEIVVPDRFIGDRELWTILEDILPGQSEIPSLVQHRS